MLCGICMDPINWTGLPTIDLFSERIDKIRGKTHSTSSRCSACKLNTEERSDDLSNKCATRTGLRLSISLPFPVYISNINVRDRFTRRDGTKFGFDLSSGFGDRWK